MALSFYKTNSNTAWIDFDKGDNKVLNVLIIHQGYQDTKDKPSNYDYILATIFEPVHIQLDLEPFSKRYKMSTDGWSMIGVSDWQEVEIPVNRAKNYIIRALFEGGF